YLAPDFALAFSHTLTSTLSLGYHIGVKWDGEFVMPIGYYALSLGIGVAEDIAVFVEAFGDMPGYAPPQHNLDAGIAWAAGEDLQLDASAGLGLNDPEEDSSDPRWLSVYATDYFVELGVSWRLRIW
ncbi:MAG: transporter, partial [Bacteroidetes bacterium]|nr:transporter [Bacteroidota bacterium]